MKKGRILNQAFVYHAACDGINHRLRCSAVLSAAHIALFAVHKSSPLMAAIPEKRGIFDGGIPAHTEIYGTVVVPEKADTVLGGRHEAPESASHRVHDLDILRMLHTTCSEG